MAFEGFEKRVELHFSGEDQGMGLRKLSLECIEETLEAVQCRVVSAVGNWYFDAYVLSESSLFVYPTKIIIKTCGTTQLLKSISPLILYAETNLGLTLSSCRYTRGSFIFPLSQPFPHTSFQDEVNYLETTLPNNLCFRKASIMPSKSSSHAWHVFTATNPHSHLPYHQTHSYTLEICMTDLDPVLARNFFRLHGREITELTGIDEINPKALVCDFAFDPCGYSMNSMDRDWYSTIHVTPEDGYSYASFECVGSINDEVDIVRVLRKVVQIFRPGTMSVSTTTTTTSLGSEVWRKVSGAVEPMGMKLRSCAMDHFPDSGSVVFQTFTPLRRKTALLQ